MVSKFYKLLIFSLLCSNQIIYCMDYGWNYSDHDSLQWDWGSQSSSSEPEDLDASAPLKEDVINDIFSDTQSAHAFLAAMADRAASPTPNSDASPCSSSNRHASSSFSDDESAECLFQMQLSAHAYLEANPDLMRTLENVDITLFSDGTTDDIFSGEQSTHAFLAAMANRAASPTLDFAPSSFSDDESTESQFQMLLSTQAQLATNRRLKSQDTSASAPNFNFARSSNDLQPISPRDVACVAIGRIASGPHAGVALVRVSPMDIALLRMRHDLASMTTHMFDSLTHRHDNLGLMAAHMHHNELASLTSSLPSQHCTVVLEDSGHATPWTPCNAQPVQYTKYTKPRFQTKHTPCKQQPTKSSSPRRKQLTNVRHRIKDNK